MFTSSRPTLEVAPGSPISPRPPPGLPPFLDTLLRPTPHVFLAPRVTETGAARCPKVSFLTSLPSHRIVPGGTCK